MIYFQAFALVAVILYLLASSSLAIYVWLDLGGDDLPWLLRAAAFCLVLFGWPWVLWHGSRKGREIDESASLD